MEIIYCFIEARLLLYRLVGLTVSARFWKLFLASRETRHIIDGLDEGHCSRPLSLYDVCKQIGEEDFCRRLKAPEVVSIDVVENLPAELRRHNIYSEAWPIPYK